MNPRHIHQDGTDSDGKPVYDVDLFLDGAWKQVKVDGKMPENAGHSNDGSLWEGLYQKAIAKAGGGYDAIVGQNTTKVMEEITGVSAHQSTDYGGDALWQLGHGGAATVVGVSQGPGWYNSRTGDFISGDSAHRPDDPNAVLIRDQHYYAAIGTEKDEAGNITEVKVDNPWNSDHDLSGGGAFNLSKEAFSKIFWGYQSTDNPI